MIPFGRRAGRLTVGMPGTIVVVTTRKEYRAMTPACGFFLHACEYSGVELVTSPLMDDAA